MFLTPAFCLPVAINPKRMQNFSRDLEMLDWRRCHQHHSMGSYADKKNKEGRRTIRHGE